MSNFNEELSKALKAHDIFEAQEKISNAFSTEKIRSALFPEKQEGEE